MKKSSFLTGITLALLMISTAALVAASSTPASAPTPPAASGEPAPGPLPAGPAVVESRAEGRTPVSTGIFGEAASRPWAVPADTGGSCGLRSYFCQDCQDGRELCYTQTCGNIVIVQCGACQPRCVLPPS
jgi:hypothetical protein